MHRTRLLHVALLAMAVLLLCAAGGCGGDEDGASSASDRSAVSATTTDPAAAGTTPRSEREAERARLRTEAAVRCLEARRRVDLPRFPARASDLGRYVRKARQRDGALVAALSAGAPADGAARREVEGLRQGYLALQPIYDRISRARAEKQRRELAALRRVLRAAEASVNAAAGDVGLAPCGPSPAP